MDGSRLFDDRNVRTRLVLRFLSSVFFEKCQQLRHNYIEKLLFAVYNPLEKSLQGGATMLFRKIKSLIEDHLQSNSKKILLIDGARQVGKTYIIRHVGHKLFENFIEINMVEDSIGPRLFAETRTSTCKSVCWKAAR
jgi:hypothetical protein